MIVLCIEGFHDYIKKGELYAVKKIWKDGDILPTGRMSNRAYSLHGIPNTTPKSGNAFAWNASRFVILNNSETIKNTVLSI